MRFFQFVEERDGEGPRDLKHIITLISGPEVDEDFIYDRIQPHIDNRKLEDDFGVHDWASSGNIDIGFTSYEVEADKYPELMKIWDKILNELGFTTGEHITVSWDYCGTCKRAFIRCKKCGNNCCNGGHGEINGEPCDACDSAYKIQQNEKPPEFYEEYKQRKEQEALL